jgi:hypothetical protein
MWTFNKLNVGNSPLKQLGLNLGAPGDRRDDHGTLWLEYPVVGGPSPKINVAVTPAEPDWFNGHAERVQSGSENGPAWVGASGARNIRSLDVQLPGQHTYRVRLHFAEPDTIQPGARIFSIHVAGQLIRPKLDLAASAGIAKTVVIDIPRVTVNGTLKIQLTPAKDSLPPVLSGIELHEIP